MGTTHADRISAWSRIPTGIVERFAHDADALARQAPGMHDTRVDIMVTAAFDGMGDMTGDNDFGVSVACLDLLDIGAYGDIIRTYAGDIPARVTLLDEYGEHLAAYLATHPHAGYRFILAYWHADGRREVMGFPTRGDMLTTYRAWGDDYAAWLDQDTDA